MIHKYDITVLQSRTVRNIMKIIESLITNSKTRSSANKKILRDAKALVDSHQVALEKIDTRTLMRLEEENTLFVKWVNRTIEEDKIK